MEFLTRGTSLMDAHLPEVGPRRDLVPVEDRLCIGNSGQS